MNVCSPNISAGYRIISDSASRIPGTMSWQPLLIVYYSRMCIFVECRQLEVNVKNIIHSTEQTSYKILAAMTGSNWLTANIQSSKTVTTEITTKTVVNTVVGQSRSIYVGFTFSTHGIESNLLFFHDLEEVITILYTDHIMVFLITIFQETWYSSKLS